MNKKVIFVGMHHKHMASNHMKALIGELVMKGVTVWKKNKHDFTFETPNVYVRYVLSGDKCEELIGMRADAVFGTVYDSMKFHMRPGADLLSNAGMCAFEYIYNVEFNALKDFDYVKQDMEEVLIITRDVNGKRTNHYLRWDNVCTYVEENFTEEDEILLVIVEGTCIYSGLSDDVGIIADDLTGFFA